ncbi:DEHA2G19734p [Debaryomyces hansenii CBS767]|uniref:DEHA2G19734p n=1 Tax=Debaryomyces hansenii (strain ATCC 36239 / CBS 767 / BCRC 21394 / JCM 1990 / NBRC 0083 / IGC 2968) TaxID=284592 RepID=Q6BHC0_DEBHA|nr:DEHA2G19734p [Debaryomyces hansenii CBS767]CAG90910.1 DEHA2G19734p [Debaryomyces hansenii CBS767]|eukprot:XP_462401.1 DEHA2G19734p [Debaryomyces hansenii CBS767]
MSFGVSYEEYTQIFNFESNPVVASSLSKYSTLFAVILVIIGT